MLSRFVEEVSHSMKLPRLFGLSTEATIHSFNRAADVSFHYFPSIPHHNGPGRILKSSHSNLWEFEFVHVSNINDAVSDWHNRGSNYNHLNECDSDN